MSNTYPKCLRCNKRRKRMHDEDFKYLQFHGYEQDYEARLHFVCSWLCDACRLEMLNKALKSLFNEGMRDSDREYAEYKKCMEEDLGEMERQ